MTQQHPNESLHQRLAAQQLWTLGTRVSWNPYIGDHLTVFAQGMGDAINSLNDRLDGWATNATSAPRFTERRSATRRRHRSIVVIPAAV